jgi:hypothetical protein
MQTFWMRFRDFVGEVLAYIIGAGTAILLLLFGWFIFLAGLTLTGFLAKSVPFICVAGTLWVLTLLFLFTLLAAGGDFAHGIDNLVSRIGDQVGSGNSMTAQLIREAATSLGAHAGQLSEFFYLAMGMTAFLIDWVARFHLSLVSRVEGRHPESPWPGSAVLLFSAVPVLLGWLVHREYIVEQFKIRLKLATAFLSSFEFLRLLLLLTAGFWGETALTAANSILAFPADDTVAGFHLGLPIGMLSDVRVNAAWTLYQIQGPFLYSAFFAAVPGLFFLIGAKRWVIHRWAAHRNAAPDEIARRLRARRPGRTMMSAWLLLLSLTVAQRSGALTRYVDGYVYRFSAEPIDHAFAGCLLDERGAVLVCLRQWELGWAREIAAVRSKVEAGLRQNQVKTFRAGEQAWRNRELPAYMADDPRRSLDVRLYWMREQARRLRTHALELRELLAKQGSSR